MNEEARERGRRLARESLARGDATGWFETLYATAHGDPHAIQWADMTANPNLVAWMKRTGLRGDGKRALVVGCGLGDDAEALARAGFDVVAFDVSPTAIEWCRGRFPGSPVRYVAADLFASPEEWQGAFDFVLESYTLQVLPPELRLRAVERIAGYAAPGGTVLVICRGRDTGDDAGRMPRPLTRAEVDAFQRYGLQDVRFEDYFEHEEAQTRRFRAEYRNSLDQIRRAPGSQSQDVDAEAGQDGCRDH